MWSLQATVSMHADDLQREMHSERTLYQDQVDAELALALQDSGLQADDKVHAAAGAASMELKKELFEFYMQQHAEWLSRRLFGNSGSQLLREWGVYCFLNCFLL